MRAQPSISITRSVYITNNTIITSLPVESRAPESESQLFFPPPDPPPTAARQTDSQTKPAAPVRPCRTVACTGTAGRRACVGSQTPPHSRVLRGREWPSCSELGALERPGQ